MTHERKAWDQAVVPMLDLDITFFRGSPEDRPETDILTITDKGQVIPAGNLTRMEAIYAMVRMLKEEAAEIERERCAKEAENTQDVCDCADRIAARIRES